MAFDTYKGNSEKSLIDYENLTSIAFQELIYKVLKQVSLDGLPGKHHFYISFITTFKNVEMPLELFKKYPEEITIVIQNTYWDLVVSKEMFKINLSFSGKKNMLKVPLKAIIGFSDPQANFNIKLPKKHIKTNKNTQNIVNIDEFKKGRIS